MDESVLLMPENQQNTGNITEQMLVLKRSEPTSKLDRVDPFEKNFDLGIFSSKPLRGLDIGWYASLPYKLDVWAPETEDRLSKQTRNNTSNTSNFSENDLPDTMNDAAGISPQLLISRNYTEIFDRFSMHELLFYDGKFREYTPEFRSFHRVNIAEWVDIQGLLNRLRTLLIARKVEFARVNGKHLRNILVHAKNNCIEDLHLLQAVLSERIPVFHRLHDVKVRHAAQITISSSFRGYIFRKRLRSIIRSVKKIQMFVRRRHFVRHLQNLRSERMREFEIIQRQFEMDENFFNVKCVLVVAFDQNDIEANASMLDHIVACSCQILKNPMLEILFIAADELSEEMWQNVSSHFSAMKWTEICSKFRYLSPPNFVKDSFRDYNIQQKVYFSLQMCARIKKICQGKKSSFVFNSYQRFNALLCADLKIPYMCWDRKSTKRTDMLQLLHSAKIQIPLFTCTSMDKLFNTLAMLIIKHKEVKMWRVSLNSTKYSLPCYSLNVDHAVTAHIVEINSNRASEFILIRNILQNRMEEIFVVHGTNFVAFEDFLKLGSEYKSDFLVESWSVNHRGCTIVNGLMNPAGRPHIFSTFSVWNNGTHHPMYFCPHVGLPQEPLIDSVSQCCSILRGFGSGYFTISFQLISRDGITSLVARDINLQWCVTDAALERWYPIYLNRDKVGSYTNDILHLMLGLDAHENERYLCCEVPFKLNMDMRDELKKLYGSSSVSNDKLLLFQGRSILLQTFNTDVERAVGLLDKSLRFLQSKIFSNPTSFRTNYIQ